MFKKAPDRRAELKHFSHEQLMDYIDVLSRNFWTVQNNWMANVTLRYGSEEAAVLDEMLWSKWPAVEAHRFKKLFNLGGGLSDVLKVMTLSLAAEEGPVSEYSQEGEHRLTLRVTRCPMQIKRIEQGWDELNCKPAFEAMWKAVIGVINPEIRISRIYAPLDPHPKNDWCGVVLEL